MYLSIKIVINFKNKYDKLQSGWYINKKAIENYINEIR